ncbi:hypothetical protein GOP47_0029595 [Adiantum capillus-veneris]|nr:hypothetical protein GOP47_0029595 [Adiantum capillus-veneris]
MGMVLDQGVTTGSHMQDCTLEACLSPSLGWLSPARISFSKDFSPHELEAVGGAVEGMSIKATGMDRSGKDSMSEFEFAMAALECNQNSENGKHMLAADELFFKGKLLPLYVPQFFSEDVEQRGSGQQQLEQKYAHRCSDSDVNLMSSSSSLSSSLSSSSSLSHVRINHGTLASSKGNESTKMFSPKTPKCSTKLRELFGLKKPKAVQSLMPATLNVVKTLPKSSSKLRKTATEAKTPLQTLGKAKRLFCRSDDGRTKVPEGRSSTSEPLLLDGCNGIETDSMPSIGCPVISLLPQHQAHHQQLYSNKPHIMHTAHTSSLCSPITRMQRSNRVSDHVEDASSKGPSLQQLRVLREAKNTENYVSARTSTSSRKVPIKEDLKPAIYRGPRRPSFQGFPYYGGSGESSPARRSSGAMSPAGSSGQWSPGRYSSGALMSGYNTACSSCRGSPGRHSTSGATPCYSPGRHSVGIEPPTLTMLDTRHGRLMRAKSLERCSSHSPKSLQRKYDQMKAMRQRDAWRPGLERSSSYNNMGSVRVVPVLNVPRVCTINRSSKSNACGHTHSNCSNAGTGGGFGIGHLFSTKGYGGKVPASSKLPLSSRRRDSHR